MKRTCEIIHLFFIYFRSDSDVYSFCSGDRGSESHTDLQHQLSSDQQHKLHLVLEPSTSDAARGPKQTPGSRPSRHAACRELLLHCQISERHQIAGRDSYSPEYSSEPGSSSSLRCCSPGFDSTDCCMVD